MVMRYIGFACGSISDENPDLKHESIKEVMRDAVLHESNRISLFGIMEVNPGFISVLSFPFHCFYLRRLSESSSYPDSR